MRFKICDKAEISGLFMKELYSNGNGGNGFVNANFDPPGPQQNQGSCL